MSLKAQIEAVVYAAETPVTPYDVVIAGTEATTVPSTTTSNPVMPSVAAGHPTVNDEDVTSLTVSSCRTVTGITTS